MKITKADWDEMVKAIENVGYTISKNLFDSDDKDFCEIIASNPQWSIRIKFEWDNLRLDLDDESGSFGSYYTPVEQMEPKLFLMCIDSILAMLIKRY